VLALQGAFARHIAAFERCGVETRAVRQPAHLDGIAGLVVPGGESTTMIKLMETFDLTEPIGKLLVDGLPTFGTCAGMILLAADVLDGHADQRCFGALDIDVRRNAYGRQVDSFEADIDVVGVPGGPMQAVFIRAPVVERAGPDVDVLATVDGAPVVCRQGSTLVSSFHPELTADDRLHQLFLSELVGR